MKWFETLEAYYQTHWDFIFQALQGFNISMVRGHVVNVWNNNYRVPTTTPLTTSISIYLNSLIVSKEWRTHLRCDYIQQVKITEDYIIIWWG
jgi:hypothetical protein